MVKVIEGKTFLLFDDDGHQSLVYQVDDGTEEENGMFVRLHSWSTKKEHSELEAFLDKKVRVTIEVIEGT